MSSMAVIQDFLAQKRIAVVGVSHDPKDFSRGLLRTMRQGGYEAVAVNPALTEADDASCCARLEDETPPVDGGLLRASPATTESVVEDCARLQIPRVWMYRAREQGRSCQPGGGRVLQPARISVVRGECPYMFLPGEKWFHRLYVFITKVSGRYPA